MFSPSCKVCNSTSISYIQHKVYRCNQCSHTFIEYQNDGILYHKELYRKPGHDGTRGRGEIEDGVFTEAFHSRRINISKKRDELIRHLYPECASLLDVGAGGGTFAELVKTNFNVTEVTEVSDLCVNNLKKSDLKVYHGSFTKINFDRSYDLVTCWHVLEHVEHLDEFLKKAVEVTNKYLIVEVPVNRRLRNPDTEFDGHFHYFSKDSFLKFFSNNFDILYLGDGVQMPCLFSIMKIKK